MDPQMTKVDQWSVKESDFMLRFIKNSVETIQSVFTGVHQIIFRLQVLSSVLCRLPNSAEKFFLLTFEVHNL